MIDNPRNDKTVIETPDAAGPQLIILAGATGQLGGRIAIHLRNKGINVRALVRKNVSREQRDLLEKDGIEICIVDFSNHTQLAEACKGASCILSALSGLEDVIIHTQTALLNAAIDAGIRRFIPSDFCIDYTKLAYGSNRNLDLRKKFNETLDKSGIAATSILNGMFTDLLTGQAPVVLFGPKRIVYWGNANQSMDFTTLENTAEFTALVAQDEHSPRYLRIAGDVLSAEGLKKSAALATGKKFSLLRAGRLGTLRTIIKITKLFSPGKKEVFPAWQGMQYMHDMFTGKPKLEPLDNNRYPDMHWTSVQHVLAEVGR